MIADRTAYFVLAQPADPDRRRQLTAMLPYITAGVAPDAVYPLVDPAQLLGCRALIIDLTLTDPDDASSESRRALAAWTHMLVRPPLLVTYKTDLHPGLPAISLPPQAVIRPYRRGINLQRLVRVYLAGLSPGPPNPHAVKP